MAIKNYTTKIPIEKTVGEIEIILAKHGAEQILKEYYGDGSVKSVSFIVDIKGNKVPFRLPINLDAWITLVNLAVKDKKLPKRFHNDSSQAARVGWRVIKDWVDAQTALIETQTVKIEQVFLPYAIINIEGQTLYEKFSLTGFKNLQLGNGDDSE